MAKQHHADKHLSVSGPGPTRRRREVSRLEGFSDAVFGIPAFAVSFALLAFYGISFAAVFTLLSLLHTHAYRSRAQLGLSDLEIYEVRASILLYASTAAIGVLSALIALLLPQQSGLAGFTHFLIALPSTLAGTLVGRRRRMEARRPLV